LILFVPSYNNLFNAKMNEVLTHSKNKNSRDIHVYIGINEFKNGYQPTTNMAKKENGHLLANSFNILNMWKNYLLQLLNVRSLSDVR
jgi:hypothetical protein